MNVDTNQRDLTLVYRADPCERIDRIEVGYEAASIIVTMFLEKGGPCLGVNVQRAEKVKLHEPLAGRSIKDGAREG